MSNLRRGEFPFTVNGHDFVLKFDMNALAELEGTLGMPLARILEDAQEQLSFRFLRAALYAGLLHDRRFKRDSATLERVGNMITMENFGDLTKAIMIGLTSAISGKHPDELAKSMEVEATKPEASSGDPFGNLIGTSTV